MIEVAALLSGLVQKWDDFAIIMVLLLTNAFIDFWQESKALNALKALKKELAKKALVFREGEFQTVEARTVVPDPALRSAPGRLPGNHRRSQATRSESQDGHGRQYCHRQAHRQYLGDRRQHL
jgi:hypothetical protein